MKKILKQNKIKIIGLLILFVIMTLNFCSYFLASNRETIGAESFSDFQQDSENLVISKIYQDRFFQKSPYGLSITYINNEKNIIGKTATDNLDYAIKAKNPIPDTSFKEYKSQFGLQGHIISFLYNRLHIPLVIIKLGITSLLSIIFIAISYTIFKKYSKSLGVIFGLTFMLSPWIIGFARNLYWVEFTWFLPGLLGLLLSKNYNKEKIYIPLIFLAILLKCLCGYEYITTIMLFTISFFVVDFFIEKNKEKKIQIVKTTFKVGIACLLGFFVAITIHASLIGNGNVFKGYTSIYEDLIAKRTLFNGDIDFEDPIIISSLNAGVFETLVKYFNWNTKIIPGIHADYFSLIVFLSLSYAIANFIKKDKDSKRDLVMYLFFFMTTVSWFVLAKGHSYIHTHMNFVLWYFGFIQICLYLLFKTFCKFIKYVSKKEID